MPDNSLVLCTSTSCWWKVESSFPFDKIAIPVFMAFSAYASAYKCEVCESYS